MLYNRLGDTGLIVSRLAFGAMTFGKAEGAYAAIFKVGQDLANELVARSLDRGVNFFNTADAYANGDSEVMLGRALGARRPDAVIATKVGMRTGVSLLRSGLSRRYVLNAAEDSLRRLGTDYIDVYPGPVLAPGPLKKRKPSTRSTCSCGRARFATSGFPTGRRGRRPRRSDCRKRRVPNRFARRRCTTAWWAGTSSMSSCRSHVTRAWGSWSGTRRPAVSSPASTRARIRAAVVVG